MARGGLSVCVSARTCVPACLRTLRRPPRLPRGRKEYREKYTKAAAALKEMTTRAHKAEKKFKKAEKKHERQVDGMKQELEASYVSMPPAAQTQLPA